MIKERETVLIRLAHLMEAYRAGELGGETMPEDENPGLPPDSSENYMYFTLPMALNYQRNSYALWRCAHQLYQDHPEIYDAKSVLAMSDSELQDLLTRYKVALQPNKQPVIWRTICNTVEEKLTGNIRNLFSVNNCSVAAIKAYIAHNKKCFPYLGGNKICNYWLSVMERYANVRFIDRECITVAPDTHVIQASLRLGVITQMEVEKSTVQQLTALRWEEMLEGTDLLPIDVHTPLWLWSRGKFSVDV